MSVKKRDEYTIETTELVFNSYEEYRSYIESEDAGIVVDIGACWAAAKEAAQPEFDDGSSIQWLPSRVKRSD